MPSTNTHTRPVTGLDSTTVWIILAGLVAVVIGAGMAGITLLTQSDFGPRTDEPWWWVATCGALLCAIGGWRAARSWSASRRDTNTDAVE